MSRRILLNNLRLSKFIAIAMISSLLSIGGSASAADQKETPETKGKPFPWVKIKKASKSPQKTTTKTALATNEVKVKPVAAPVKTNEFKIISVVKHSVTTSADKSPTVYVKPGKVATSKDVKLKKSAFNLEKLAKEKETKPEVLSVARQLEQLLKPSDTLIMAKKEHKKDEIYYKVIKGRNNQSTLIYRCRFIQANKTLSNTLSSIISAEGSVECSEEQNMVVLHDASDKMDELRESLMALDISSPQVLVEAKVVEVLLSDGMQREFSLLFNKSQDGFDQSGGLKTSIPGKASDAAATGANLDWLPVLTGNADGNFKNMQVAIEWLLNSQNARILSSPNVIVSRNTTASIVTGKDIPIQEQTTTSGSVTTSTKFKRVGVTLDVTPRLINNNSVRLFVNPQVSSVLENQQITQGTSSYTVPIISIRNVSTELTLEDGQIIIIGGLFSHVETLQQERIPFVSDIPYLGEFFTGKNKSLSVTQLIFFLKVNILSEQELKGGVLYDPAVQARTIRKVSEVLRDSKIFPKPKSSIEQAREEFIEKSPAYR